MNDYCLTPKEQFLNYQDENKLHFDEIRMYSETNTLHIMFKLHQWYNG
jgi:hypothetical protein